MECSGRGFKSHLGQLSVATSKYRLVVNTIYIYIYIYIYSYIHRVILRKQDGHNTYAIMKIMCLPSYYQNSFMAIQARGHMMYVVYICIYIYIYEHISYIYINIYDIYKYIKMSPHLL